MSRKFGGASSRGGQQSKVLIFVGLGVFLFILLGVLIVMLSLSGNSSPSVEVAQNQPAVVKGAEKVVVSVRPIEKSSKIDETMFVLKPYDQANIPAGAFTESQLNDLKTMFAAQRIEANFPITASQVSKNPPLSVIDIPPGYRAVTILVDKRTGVEGFAKPGTRVDINLNYTPKLKGTSNTPDYALSKSLTLVRYVKVLSVGGTPSVQDANKAKVDKDTPVTILVSEADARKVDLGRSLGTLSLALVGEGDSGAADLQGPDAVDLNTLFGKQDADEPCQGVMYTNDKVTGKKVKYCLKNNKWAPEEK